MRPSVAQNVLHKDDSVLSVDRNGWRRHQHTVCAPTSCAHLALWRSFPSMADGWRSGFAKAFERQNTALLPEPVGV